MTGQPAIHIGRRAGASVEPLFLERWSPRAFDGSAIPEQDLHTIFDAARWAPSAFNYQPWRFLYACRDTDDWPRFLSLLMPFNRSWAENASVLILVLSDRLMQFSPNSEATPSHSHSFDAGAAWALLALQATRLGYHAHGMTGVELDQARTELAVPDRFRIEAAVAIGRMGDRSQLPQKLQEREMPSDRHAVQDIAYAGNFVG